MPPGDPPDPGERARLAAARYEVVARVAHDLRTPLNTILLACDSLLLASAEQDRARYVAAIQRAGRRAEQLLAELAELAELEHGALALDRRPVELRAVLADVARARPDAAVDPSGLDEGAVVEVDRARLAQALAATLAYAARGSDGNAPRLVARVEPSAVELAIAWTPGDEHVAMVLAQPWRARSPGSTAPSLWLARALVEAQGGTVRAESDAASTRVVVRLPRR